MNKDVGPFSLYIPNYNSTAVFFSPAIIIVLMVAIAKNM